MRPGKKSWQSRQRLKREACAEPIPLEHSGSGKHSSCELSNRDAGQPANLQYDFIIQVIEESSEEPPVPMTTSAATPSSQALSGMQGNELSGEGSPGIRAMRSICRSSPFS